jgi:lipoate-protein ligase A
MDGPDNMALDAALMLRARQTGDTVLRVYGWSEPTLSFGRNQRALGAYDAGTVARAGLGVVRRPTGGRALLHHREITYSVTAPLGEPLGSTYHRINALLVNALARLGVPAEVAAPEGPSRAPTGTPCFAEPAQGELVVRGRKLVGSAQWRDEGALLQHGSILVDDDQHRLAALSTGAAGRVPAPATLRELLGRAPGTGEVVGCLLAAVRALADPGADQRDLEPVVHDDARRLAPGYRSEAWTWRR